VRLNVPLLLIALVALNGCGKPSKSPSKSRHLPLVRVQPTQDDGQALAYHWEHHGKDTACLIGLPNRTQAPVTLRFRQVAIDGQQVGAILIDSEYPIEVGKILSDQAMIFVRPGEVIPYHDQLYHVTFDETSLDLRRVTHHVPSKFHPDPKHLVISRSESPQIRERLYLLNRDIWADYERVRINHIAEDASHAVYEGKPYYGSAQGAKGDKTIEPQEIVHQWAGSSTVVAQIVPPIEIEGVGKLRGWVAFRQAWDDQASRPPTVGEHR